MFSLAYKTFGDSSNQGKERVYFTCHPADFEPCFSPIVADIHRLHNCAVYYNPEPATALPEAERQELLGSMRLLVIPVTTRFLLEPNPAMDVDLPFAIEHNIPVLPLMQEPGLGAIFNKKCGGLQYLDKNAQDITAVSFDKKFSDFLNSILLSDELMQKIRNSFDAYIFLSYRKKDRRYANQLMRSIHSNPRYRDIAIWYDEYLAVGRNFKASIDTAMNNSRLFVLLVTQNLLEPGNYVLEHEYKDARALAKPLPILPVQMADTDPVQMQLHYAQLPEIVDGHDPDALEKALQAQLTGIANPENDSDPLHNYYIGLAYLGGVDVEVDHARALTLITAAAEAGLPEAMEKLSSMYENGEGVPIHLPTAVLWSQRAAEHCKALYQDNLQKYEAQRNSQPELANAYLQMAQNTAMMYCLRTNISLALLERLNRPQQLRQLSMELLAFCQSAPAMLSLSDQLVAAYHWFGNTEKMEGHLSDAMTYLQKELEIIEARYRASGSGEDATALAKAYSALGDLAEANNQHPAAQDYHEKALYVLRLSVQADNTQYNRLKLADGCVALGNICFHQENYAPALEYLTEAFRIRESEAFASGTERSQLLLAESYDLLGNLAIKAAGLCPEDAQSYFARALALRQAQVENTQSVAAQSALSDSYRSYGNYSLSQKDIPGALDYYQRSIAICERYAEQDTSFYENTKLAVVYSMAAATAEALKKYAFSQAYYEKALPIYRLLAEESGSVRARQNLADCYSSLSTVHKMQDALSPAMDYMEKCLLLREELLPETESAAQLDKICEMYRKLNQLCKARGLEDRGWEYGEKLFAFEDTLATDADTPKARLRRAKAYSKLGGYARTEQKLPLARFHYNKVLQLLSDTADTEAELLLLSESCQKLADMAESPLAARVMLLQQLAADEKNGCILL